MTSEIFELIGERDEAFEEAYARGQPGKLGQAKKLRTASKRVVCTARADYIKHKLEANAQNPCEFWKDLNKLIKGDLQGSSIPITILKPITIIHTLLLISTMALPSRLSKFLALPSTRL